MRKIFMCGVNPRWSVTISTAVHTYKASSDTPRGSVLGFTLLACLSIQLLSGLFVTARVFESSEILHFVGLLHRAIPLFFVVVLSAHLIRAFSSSSVAGFAALKSGGAVLVFLIIALGTGYMLAAAGEAGYWGAVISVFNFSAFAVDFLIKLVLSVGILLGISFGLNTDVLHAALIGSTTVSPVVFYYIIFFVHLAVGILLFWFAAVHMGVTHSSGSVAGVTLRSGFRASLAAVVESRDLRFVLLAGAIPLLTIASMTWLFRGGNGVLLNTEIKPPARVATEVYFAGVYGAFRYMPLVSCILLFVGFAAAWWFLISRPIAAQTKLAILGVSLVVIAVFSATGFLPIDLIEHALVDGRRGCLRCLLLEVYADDSAATRPTVRREFYTLTKKQMRDPVNREIIRWSRRAIAEGTMVITVIPDDVVTPPSFMPSDPRAVCEIIDGQLLAGEWWLEEVQSGEKFVRWWKTLLARDTTKPTVSQLYTRWLMWRSFKAQGLV